MVDASRRVPTQWWAVRKYGTCVVASRSLSSVPVHALDLPELVVYRYFATARRATEETMSVRHAASTWFQQRDRPMPSARMGCSSKCDTLGTENRRSPFLAPLGR